jgi:hypothetical protein
MAADKQRLSKKVDSKPSTTLDRWLSFWQTLPGLVTAAAALITAVVGAIVGLHQAGIFPKVDEPPTSGRTSDNPHAATPSLTSTARSSRHGKLGDELSTSQWIFQVRDVSETDEYAERYYQAGRLIRPQGVNDILIVIDARLKNPLQTTQTPVLTERDPQNTGLVDDADHSYQPVDYDARQSQDKIMSAAAAPFALPRGKIVTEKDALLHVARLSQGLIGWVRHVVGVVPLQNRFCRRRAALEGHGRLDLLIVLLLDKIPADGTRKYAGASSGLPNSW